MAAASPVSPAAPPRATSGGLPTDVSERVRHSTTANSDRASSSRLLHRSRGSDRGPPSATVNAAIAEKPDDFFGPASLLPADGAFLTIGSPSQQHFAGVALTRPNGEEIRLRQELDRRENMLVRVLRREEVTARKLRSVAITAIQRFRHEHDRLLQSQHDVFELNEHIVMAKRTEAMKHAEAAAAHIRDALREFQATDGLGGTLTQRERRVLDAYTASVRELETVQRHNGLLNERVSELQDNIVKIQASTTAHMEKLFNDKTHQDTSLLRIGLEVSKLATVAARSMTAIKSSLVTFREGLAMDAHAIPQMIKRHLSDNATGAKSKTANGGTAAESGLSAPDRAKLDAVEKKVNDVYSFLRGHAGLFDGAREVIALFKELKGVGIRSRPAAHESGVLELRKGNLGAILRVFSSLHEILTHVLGPCHMAAAEVKLPDTDSEPMPDHLRAQAGLNPHDAEFVIVDQLKEMNRSLERELFETRQSIQAKEKAARTLAIAEAAATVEAANTQLLALQGKLRDAESKIQQQQATLNLLSAAKAAAEAVAKEAAAQRAPSAVLLPAVGAVDTAPHNVGISTMAVAGQPLAGAVAAGTSGSTVTPEALAAKMDMLLLDESGDRRILEDAEGRDAMGYSTLMLQYANRQVQRILWEQQCAELKSTINGVKDEARENFENENRRPRDESTRRSASIAAPATTAAPVDPEGLVPLGQPPLDPGIVPSVMTVSETADSQKPKGGKGGGAKGGGAKKGGRTAADGGDPAATEDSLALKAQLQQSTERAAKLDQELQLQQKQTGILLAQIEQLRNTAPQAAASTKGGVAAPPGGRVVLAAPASKLADKTSQTDDAPTKVYADKEVGEGTTSGGARRAGVDKSLQTREDTALRDLKAKYDSMMIAATSQRAELSAALEQRVALMSTHDALEAEVDMLRRHQKSSVGSYDASAQTAPLRLVDEELERAREGQIVAKEHQIQELKVQVVEAQRHAQLIEQLMQRDAQQRLKTLASSTISSLASVAVQTDQVDISSDDFAASSMLVARASAAAHGAGSTAPPPPADAPATGGTANPKVAGKGGAKKTKLAQPPGKAGATSRGTAEAIPDVPLQTIPEWVEERLDALESEKETLTSTAASLRLEVARLKDIELDWTRLRDPLRYRDNEAQCLVTATRAIGCSALTVHHSLGATQTERLTQADCAQNTSSVQLNHSSTSPEAPPLVHSAGTSPVSASLHRRSATTSPAPAPVALHVGVNTEALQATQARVATPVSQSPNLAGMPPVAGEYVGPSHGVGEMAAATGQKTDGDSHHDHVPAVQQPAQAPAELGSMAQAPGELGSMAQAPGDSVPAVDGVVADATSTKLRSSTRTTTTPDAPTCAIETPMVVHVGVAAAAVQCELLRDGRASRPRHSESAQQTDAVSFAQPHMFGVQTLVSSPSQPQPTLNENSNPEAASVSNFSTVVHHAQLEHQRRTITTLTKEVNELRELRKSLESSLHESSEALAAALAQLLEAQSASLGLPTPFASGAVVDGPATTVGGAPPPPAAGRPTALPTTVPSASYGGTSAEHQPLQPPPQAAVIHSHPTAPSLSHDEAVRSAMAQARALSRDARRSASPTSVSLISSPQNRDLVCSPRPTDNKQPVVAPSVASRVAARDAGIQTTSLTAEPAPRGVAPERQDASSQTNSLPSSSTTSPVAGSSTPEDASGRVTIGLNGGGVAALVAPVALPVVHLSPPPSVQDVRISELERHLAELEITLQKHRDTSASDSLDLYQLRETLRERDQTIRDLSEDLVTTRRECANPMALLGHIKELKSVLEQRDASLRTATSSLGVFAAQVDHLITWCYEHVRGSLWNDAFQHWPGTVQEWVDVNVARAVAVDRERALASLNARLAGSLEQTQKTLTSSEECVATQKVELHALSQDLSSAQGRWADEKDAHMCTLRRYQGELEVTKKDMQERGRRYQNEIVSLTRDRAALQLLTDRLQSKVVSFEVQSSLGDQQPLTASVGGGVVGTQVASEMASLHEKLAKAQADLALALKALKQAKVVSPLLSQPAGDDGASRPGASLDQSLLSATSTTTDDQAASASQLKALLQTKTFELTVAQSAFDAAVAKLTERLSGVLRQRDEMASQLYRADGDWASADGVALSDHRQGLGSLSRLDLVRVILEGNQPSDPIAAVGKGEASKSEPVPANAAGMAAPHDATPAAKPSAQATIVAGTSGGGAATTALKLVAAEADIETLRAKLREATLQDVMTIVQQKATSEYGASKEQWDAVYAALAASRGRGTLGERLRAGRRPAAAAVMDDAVGSATRRQVAVALNRVFSDAWPLLPAAAGGLSDAPALPASHPTQVLGTEFSKPLIASGIPVLEQLGTASFDFEACWQRVSAMSFVPPFVTVVANCLSALRATRLLGMSLERVVSFLRRVNNLCNDRNPFSNSHHAAIAVHSCFFALVTSPESVMLTPEHQVAAIFALASIHVAHSGCTASFLARETSTSEGVQRLYHFGPTQQHLQIALVKALMGTPACDFAVGLSSASRRELTESTLALLGQIGAPGSVFDLTERLRLAEKTDAVGALSFAATAAMAYASAHVFGTHDRKASISCLEDHTAEQWRQGDHDRARGTPETADILADRHACAPVLGDVHHCLFTYFHRPLVDAILPYMGPILRDRLAQWRRTWLDAASASAAETISKIVEELQRRQAAAVGADASAWCEWPVRSVAIAILFPTPTATQATQTSKEKTSASAAAALIAALNADRRRDHQASPMVALDDQADVDHAAPREHLSGLPPGFGAVQAALEGNISEKAKIISALASQCSILQKEVDELKERVKLTDGPKATAIPRQGSPGSSAHPAVHHVVLLPRATLPPASCSGQPLLSLEGVGRPGAVQYLHAPVPDWADPAASGSRRNRELMPLSRIPHAGHGMARSVAEGPRRRTLPAGVRIDDNSLFHGETNRTVPVNEQDLTAAWRTQKKSGPPNSPTT